MWSHWFINWDSLIPSWRKGDLVHSRTYFSYTLGPDSVSVNLSLKGYWDEQHYPCSNDELATADGPISPSMFMGCIFLPFRSTLVSLSCLPLSRVELSYVTERVWAFRRLQLVKGWEFHLILYSKQHCSPGRGLGSWHPSRLPLNTAVVLRGDWQTLGGFEIPSLGFTSSRQLS